VYFIIVIVLCTCYVNMYVGINVYFVSHHSAHNYFSISMNFFLQTAPLFLVSMMQQGIRQSALSGTGGSGTFADISSVDQL